MRVLGAAVLTMESLLMGFALLLAMRESTPLTLWLGGAVALLLLLTAGLLRKKSGWILGTLLQFGLIAYGIVVPTLYLMGAIFAGLWIAAIVVGRKGEAARASLMAKGEKNS